MKLELIEEAKTVALKSWASRVAIASATFGGLAQLQPHLPQIQAYVPHDLFTGLSLACAIAVPIARVLKQESISGA